MALHGAKLNIIISRLFLSQDHRGFLLFHPRVDSFSQRLQRGAWNSKEKLVLVVTKWQDITSDGRIVKGATKYLRWGWSTQHCLKGQMELLHTDSATPCSVLSGPRQWRGDGPIVARSGKEMYVPLPYPVGLISQGVETGEDLCRVPQMPSSQQLNNRTSLTDKLHKNTLGPLSDVRRGQLNQIPQTPAPQGPHPHI